jgi:hypothetical protein
MATHGALVLRPSPNQLAIDFVLERDDKWLGKNAFIKKYQHSKSHMMACDEVSIIMTGQPSPCGWINYQKIVQSN